MNLSLLAQSVYWRARLAASAAAGAARIAATAVVRPVRDIDRDVFEQVAHATHRVETRKYSKDFLAAVNHDVLRRARQSMDELHNLWWTASHAPKRGAFGILGSFQAGDALMICRMKDVSRMLCVFDAFELGMPPGHPLHDQS